MVFWATFERLCGAHEPTGITRNEACWKATARLRKAVVRRDIYEARRALEAGADANAVRGGGRRLSLGPRRPALHCAVIGCSDISMAQLLLDNGANINERDKYGNTVLHCVARHSAPADVLAFLIERGADVNANNNVSHTPIDEAVLRNGRHKGALVALLEEAGGRRTVHGSREDDPRYINFCGTSD